MGFCMFSNRGRPLIPSRGFRWRRKHDSFRCHSRTGVTAIELLTVISIIGLLSGLMLPAIQSARERARMLQCSNNLRQIGVAYHGFASSHGQFPPLHNKGLPSIPGGNLSGYLFRSAQYFLLPGLEQSELYQRIDVSSDSWTGYDPPVSRLNQRHLETRIPVFQCPSDDVPIGGISYLISQGTSSNGFTTPGYPPPNTVVRGVGTGVRAAVITDGLSNTVAFSERLVGDHDPSRYTPARDVAWSSVLQNGQPPTILPDAVSTICASGVRSASGHTSFCSTGWLFGYFGTTSYNHVLRPNSEIPDCTSPYVGFGAYSARSFHRSGVSVLYADGASDFVSEEVDVAVWRAIGSINGHEPETRSP
jgi:type II secretory pathway pseudopilin PulG